MPPGSPDAIPATPSTSRLPALDWMRGLVMVVMAVDHCDLFYNAHHALGDSAGFRQPFPLSPPDFLTRWCTHLCAPSFVFLAGTGMAISAANSARRGESAASIDRYLLVRGLVLFGIEVFYLSLASSHMRGGSPSIFLQVIYAIGAGMIAMTLLRRLSSRGLVAGAAALLVLCEVAYGQLAGRAQSLPALLALMPGSWSSGPRGDWFDPSLTVLYPALPWLPPMMLGWAFGRRLAMDGTLARPLLLGGLGLLALFAVVRGADGFGNMGMHRRDGSVLEWLNCSKYPPSIAFFAMELGVMGLLLAVFFVLQRRVPRAANWNPLLVIGQVPMFFYLVHMPMIACWGALGVFTRPQPWWMSWVAALCTVAVLLPACGAYRWYKQTKKHAWTRYL
ncbi:MAG TPA: heparan-alpha-glucosaminide N-acetyltransferase domain-containing protein [Planctomycetota bacterium]|nr:heparan-alpha-glucosaminide N-acetyltransferase domain-containing protein [Planctomycetota bacterium]